MLFTRDKFSCGSWMAGVYDSLQDTSTDDGFAQTVLNEPISWASVSHRVHYTVAGWDCLGKATDDIIYIIGLKECITFLTLSPGICLLQRLARQFFLPVECVNRARLSPGMVCVVGRAQAPPRNVCVNLCRA